jgi:hypothetical protein
MSTNVDVLSASPTGRVAQINSGHCPCAPEHAISLMPRGAEERDYCFSYSPLPSRFRTVNPAFLASEMDRGLLCTGELKLEMSLRTGLLHKGHLVSSGALIGRRRVNFPPQTMHSPSQSSYSYSGIRSDQFTADRERVHLDSETKFFVPHFIPHLINPEFAQRATCRITCGTTDEGLACPRA